MTLFNYLEIVYQYDNTETNYFWNVAIASKPPHDKTNKIACEPSQDRSAWHLPYLIRGFIVCMMKAWVLSYPLSAQRRLIRLGGCPGWSESWLGTHLFCCFCHEMAHLWFVWIMALNHPIVPISQYYLLHHGPSQVHGDTEAYIQGLSWRGKARTGLPMLFLEHP